MPGHGDEVEAAAAGDTGTTFWSPAPAPARLAEAGDLFAPLLHSPQKLPPQIG